MAQRNTILVLLKNIFLFDAESSRWADEIERGCYAATRDDCPGEAQWTDRFTASYSAIVYRVITALADGHLQERVLSGEVDTRRLAYMRSDELDPAANAAIRAEIALRSEQRIERSVCTGYICDRCKINKTDGGQEQQRRNADEGTSLKIECLECGFRWRIG